LIETYQLDNLKQTNIFKQLVELGYEINKMPEGYCEADYIMKIK
jgi:hypothetical protein